MSSSSLMPELTCFRLLDAESPAGPLADAVRQVNAGQGGPAVFTLDPVSFELVPNAPFAYWVEEKVRRLFKELPAFESGARIARAGLCTGDDFRYVRCWWEVPTDYASYKDRHWMPFAKGGAFSPYYADLHLVINWGRDGELLGMVGNHAASKVHYFRPGLTWPRRTNGLSFRVMPAGAVFSEKGPAIFDDAVSLGLCAILNSKCFGYLVSVQLARVELAQSYEAGIIKHTPLPVLMPEKEAIFNQLATKIWQQKYLQDTSQEISHAFVAPGFERLPSSYAEYEAGMVKQKAIWLEISSMHQDAIEKNAEEIFTFKAPIVVELGNLEEHNDEEGLSVNLGEARVLLSYLVGVAFSRWAIPANPEELRKPPADPFAPLPAQAPGAAPVEAAKLYFAEDASGESPLLDSCRDALRGVTGLALIDGYEQDLAARLGVPTIRDYLSRPAAFFADHLGVYSKSRRQAPIYWPLSTRSGEFILWVYYPKLDADSLPRLITEVLDPRLRALSEEISTLVAEGRTAGRRAKLEALQLELSEMRQDFQALIAKGYKPDLNDGVLITACPLAKYFRHAGFRKNLEACWKELARGDYDWSHLAMSMWPERVIKACRNDRSIAIAHGREDLCPAEPPKAPRGRKKKID